MQIYRISGDGNKLLERYMYDKANRVKTKWTYTDSYVGIKEEYQYDPIDRVTERKVYSLESRTPLLYMETTKYEYGISTTVTTAEDGTATAKIRKERDSYNRLISVEQISDDITLKTSYKYDELGNRGV